MRPVRTRMRGGGCGRDAVRAAHAWSADLPLDVPPPASGPNRFPGHADGGLLSGPGDPMHLQGDRRCPVRLRYARGVAHGEVRAMSCVPLPRGPSGTLDSIPPARVVRFGRVVGTRAVARANTDAGADPDEPRAARSRRDTFPTRHVPNETRSQRDTTPTRHDPNETRPQRDTTPPRHDPDETQRRIRRCCNQTIDVPLALPPWPWPSRPAPEVAATARTAGTWTKWAAWDPESRVAAGGCPPAAPTDPSMRD